MDLGRFSAQLFGLISTTLNNILFQVFIDATFGSGGHTAAILMSAKCKVYALDRDPAANEIAEILSERPEFKGRMFPVLGKFSQICKVLKSHGVKYESVNGKLLVIGASSIQFEDPDGIFILQKWSGLWT